MTTAITPYVAWMSATAARAEQSAGQARAAVAAYDAAFTATVPPPVIAANRSLLMSLIATNILGQNTTAIAAAEAHYAEMWAQDAAAMYGYAGASASAARVTPFTVPPATTNPAGPGGQHAAAAVNATAAGVGAQAQSTLSQLISAVPQALQGLATSGPSTAAQAESPLLALLDSLAGPLSPVSLYGIAGVPYLLAMQSVLLPMNGANVVSAISRALAAPAAAGELAGGLGGGAQLVSSPVRDGAASTGIGNAGSVGRLSVPQGWTAATRTAKTVAGALPGAAAVVAVDSQSALLSDVALGGLAGRAIGAAGAGASRAVGGVTRLTAESKPS
jgi:PPE-repeat protein